MNTKPIRTTLAVFMALLVAASAVPAVSAQSATLEITEANGPKEMRPEIDFESMKIKFEYGFTNPGVSVGGAAISKATVKLTPDCPNFVIVSGPTKKLVTIEATGASAGGTFPGEVSWDIGVTRQAPGLQSINCDIRYSADEYNAVFAPAVAESKQGFIVSAGYYGAMQVKLAQPLQKAGPQKEVNFDLELTNFGNAKTTVLFGLGSEPSGKRWEQLLPPPLIIDTLTTGGNNKDVATFQVSTPYKTGWNNELGTYQIVMNTEAFDDPNQKGNTMTADVLVRVRGVYVPGFEVVALVGSLVGSVVLLRGRDEE